MVGRGENRSTWREASPMAAWSTTSRTWTDMESNPGLRDLKPEFHVTNILKTSSSYLTENTVHVN
jgi:hypothetical protein